MYANLPLSPRKARHFPPYAGEADTKEESNQVFINEIEWKLPQKNRIQTASRSRLSGKVAALAVGRGKCEQTQKNGDKCEKKVKDDFYRATLNTCLSFPNEVKNLAKDTGIKDSNLCTQTCPYRLAGSALPSEFGGS